MARSRLTRGDACAILSTSGAGHTRDFYTLRNSTVANLVEAARKIGYRKSKNAPGSTGRMFYAYLQRLCK